MRMAEAAEHQVMYLRLRSLAVGQGVAAEILLPFFRLTALVLHQVAVAVAPLAAEVMAADLAVCPQA